MHAHSHSSSRNPAFALGLSLNVAFIIAEIAAGVMADSLSLLADAGHNVGDVAGLLLAWGAVALARKDASPRFTYGLQSASIIAALANALLLVAAVGGIAWEASHRFASPEMPGGGVMIAAAAVGVAVNGFTAWLFRGEHDLNLRAVFLHMALDAAVSFGVVLAGIIILATGWLWVDPLMSLLIAAAIIFSAWQLMRESLRLALHGVPSGIDALEVKAWLTARGGVQEVHDLHIWATSTSAIAMSAHLLMPGGHPGDAFLRETAHALEAHFRITHATLQIELGDGAAHCELHCEHAHG